MKIKHEKGLESSKITFIPETTEEKLIMGTLRDHYFYGDDESGTFPEYDGITSNDNFVTSMTFKFKHF